MEAIPDWKSILLIFQLVVWIFTIAQFVFIVLIIYLAGKLSITDGTVFKKISNIIFIVFSMMVGNSMAKYPKKLLIKIVFMLWAFFCLNWSATYTTALFSMMTTAINKNEVCNIKYVHIKI